MIKIKSKNIDSYEKWWKFPCKHKIENNKISMSDGNRDKKE